MDIIAVSVKTGRRTDEQFNVAELHTLSSFILL